MVEYISSFLLGFKNFEFFSKTDLKNSEFANIDYPNFTADKKFSLINKLEKFPAFTFISEKTADPEILEDLKIIFGHDTYYCIKNPSDESFLLLFNEECEDKFNLSSMKESTISEITMNLLKIIEDASLKIYS